MNYASSAVRFQRLVARIFAKNDFKVEEERTVAANLRPQTFKIDLLLTWAETTRTVVEVRLLRSRLPQLRDLKRSIDILLEAQAALPADHAMLVTNVRREHLDLPSALLKGVELLTMDDLMSIAGDDPDLLIELGDFERELSSSLRDFDQQTDELRVNPEASITQFKIGNPRPRPTPPSPTPRHGHEFAEDLRAIKCGTKEKMKLPSGREGVPWSLFEQVSYEGLQYLFKGVFDRWSKQKAVSGKANRMDAMAKIVGDDVFCQTLVQDFKTRRILFEFKCYREELPANLIYITEKYLFPTARRATAILISPRGFSDDAKDASFGALRDAEKLMLDLDLSTFCEMLEQKDEGISPGLRMEELLDNFLQEIGR
ncbi:MAG: hypothetical protein ACN4E6_16140 [Qipengyuania pacifica]